MDSDEGSEREKNGFGDQINIVIRGLLNEVLGRGHFGGG